MWVNKRFFEKVLAENETKDGQVLFFRSQSERACGANAVLREQKAKDDVTIDWMRHRVNALEKQNSILVMKTSGVLFPVPEIVPSRPGTMSAPPDFPSMPSFEDVGDTEADRLGIVHDEEGVAAYTK